jgi:hypothetical protein
MKEKKENVMGGIVRDILKGGRKMFSCFEGSHEVPARPSGRGTFEGG